jgi:hypothetical protein
MSINQISTANTFGQLVTAVSAMIAVANNLTDGPQVVTNAAWTFSNPGVGINVGNTAIIRTGNVSILNTTQANVTNETIGRSNISTANITVANIVGATVTNLITTNYTTANANISGLLQVSDRANIFSANIQSANIGTVSITSLSATSLTVPVLNASFANITTLSVTGTSQHQAIVAVLTTTDNANVRILNSSFANITNETVGTANISVANITNLTVGTQNISAANITTLTGLVSLSTTFANITTSTTGTANISTANITNLFANVANLVSVNIASVNITTGSITVSANPTVNLQVATKNYVDTGAGANLVNKLSFNAKGDIIVGTGANTFATMNVGANGLVVLADTNQTNGLRYAPRASQQFRGLVMGTSLADKVANGSQLVVYNLDEAIMDDGEVVTGWPAPTSIDISSNGAVNLLDTGVVLANTWYEVYAIRKRVDGTKGFLIHRAKDRRPDQNTFNAVLWTIQAGAAAALGANSTSGTANVRLAQSFTPNVAGPLTSIEIRAFKTGATCNGNVWLTLEANTAGSPNGTPLATSRKMDLTRLQITNPANLRFVFDTTANVSLATSYFWVFQTDYPGNGTLFANLAYSLANTTLNANGVNEGVPRGFNGASWVDLRPGVGTFVYKTYVEANSSNVSMPTGYDQKCLISYAGVDANTKLKEYHQKDRTVYAYYSAQWASPPITQITNPEVVDLLFVVPPVPVMVGFLHTGGGSPLIYSLGRFFALDLATVTTTEGTYGGGFQYGQGGGGTSAMVLPFWVEHQAVLTKVQTAGSKFYPAWWTF